VHFIFTSTSIISAAHSFFKISFARENVTRPFPISNVSTGNTNLYRVQNVAYNPRVGWTCSIPNTSLLAFTDGLSPPKE
jgi:hypothetical protein